MTLSLKTLLVASAWTAVTASVLSSAISLTGCSLGETTPIPDGGDGDFDGGDIPADTTGGSSTGGASDAAIPLGLVRLANMTKGGPALDFCWRSGTGEFQGPVLKSNGLAGGAQFTQVSARFPISAASTKAAKALEFRIVPVDGDAGAGSCPAADAGAAATYTVKTSLAGGAGLTLVTYGDATDATAPATSLGVADILAGSPGTVGFRQLPAAPGVAPYDVQVGQSGTVLTGLKYGSVVPFPYTTPANGFVSLVAPIEKDTPIVLLAGRAVLGKFPLPALPETATVTSFLIGRYSATASTLEVIACDDNNVTTTTPSTPLTTCWRIPAVATP